MRLDEFENQQLKQEIIKIFLDAGWKDITSKISIVKANGNKLYRKFGKNMFAKVNFFNGAVVFYQKENDMVTNHKKYRLSLRDLPKIKLAVLCNSNNEMP